MGIHGSATCVMNYEGATGWLVGERDKGLRAMFTMMNEARLGVGIQGLALSEVATPERRGLRPRAPAGEGADRRRPTRAPPADTIIVHPDIRRTLAAIRGFNIAARALALETALDADIAARSPDEKARQRRRGSAGPADAGRQGRAHRPRLRQRRRRPAGLRRPRLHRRDRHRAVRPRRPHRHDLRGRQRHPGARSRRPQAAPRRRPRRHGVLQGSRRLHQGARRRGAGAVRRAAEEGAGRSAGGHHVVHGRTPWPSPTTPAPAPPTIMHLFGLVALGYMWARIAVASHERSPPATHTPRC